LTRFVLDASVAVAWCFEDETTAYTENVLDLLAGGNEALAPALWPYEVANGLAVAERRKRTTWAKITRFLERLIGLPISVVADDRTQVFGRVLPTARQQGLAVYDAAYLELALREALPLATLDTDLRKAAQGLGIKIVSTK
jgi:predicted nucleic acid-binding protein